jgi:hypothetical protein
MLKISNSFGNYSASDNHEGHRVVELRSVVEVIPLTGQKSGLRSQ